MYIQATLKGLSRLYCTYCQVQRKVPESNRKKDKWLFVLLLACESSCWPPESQVLLVHFKVHDNILVLLTSSTLNFPSAGASSHPQLLILLIPAISASPSLSTLLSSPLLLSLLLCLWPCSVNYFLCSRLFQKSLRLFSFLCY